MTTPGYTTLGEIRGEARQRADMVNSQFITDAEWNLWINQSYRELYGILVQKFGAHYYTSKVTLTATGSSEYLALPVDLFKFRGISIILTAAPNGEYRLDPFDFNERDVGNFPTNTANGWP